MFSFGILEYNSYFRYSSALRVNLDLIRIDQSKIYSKTRVKQPLSKRPKIGFQDQSSLNAGQKYCRMQHSAILSTFIKLPFVIKIFVLSIFEWPFYTVICNFLV